MIQIQLAKAVIMCKEIFFSLDTCYDIFSSDAAAAAGIIQT
jgi:hypothetical protein